MNRPYWSLRNKAEDIDRALGRGDSASARLAAYELGVRFSHTVTAAREHKESRSAEGQASSGEQPIERAFPIRSGVGSIDRSPQGEAGVARRGGCATDLPAA